MEYLKIKPDTHSFDTTKRPGILCIKKSYSTLYTVNFDLKIEHPTTKIWTYQSDHWNYWNQNEQTSSKPNGDYKKPTFVQMTNGRSLAKVILLKVLAKGRPNANDTELQVVRRTIITQCSKAYRANHLI